MEIGPFGFANARGFVPGSSHSLTGFARGQQYGEFSPLHGAQRALYVFMNKKRMKAATSGVLLPD
ncbi:hypothetical protein DSLASN_43620 [Desulfoluna limicola]|uniref:Uncharacterized protein n=1 Tax=Desulfoluna limicola TaxID=2810562 RepID=A0ABM7PNU1_9BACT|nr:hypothetical protein DSLASN_43620 [Desulfoluna limicola]